jgi:hypothetical protein
MATQMHYQTGLMVRDLSIDVDVSSSCKGSAATTTAAASRQIQVRYAIPLCVDGGQL